VAYPEGWFYVERAVVIVFGLSAQLAPTLNTVAVGFPYVMRLMAASQAQPRAVGGIAGAHAMAAAPLPS
jgi:hypothetical protein